jgi:hypothetical protein
VIRHHVDPDEADRERYRAEAHAAPRLSPQRRARLAELLDTSDLGPARHYPPVSRGESAQVHAVTGLAEPDTPGVKSDTGSTVGTAGGRTNDR